jgi:hypothetical protein
MRIRSLAKHALALPALTLGLLLVLSGPAAAEETWAVRSGRTTIHFNTPLLRDLGVEVTDVAGTLPRPVDLWIEGPNWTFPIDESSDLGFRTLAGVVVPGGITGGAIRHGGEFAIVSTQNGARTEFKAPEIAYVDPKVYSSDLPINPSLIFRSGGDASPITYELHDSMFRFDRDTRVLRIHYLSFRVSESWAKEMGRPDLAGWFVGNADVTAEVELVAQVGTEPAPYEPNFSNGILDVALGILSSIRQSGHEGVFPTGRTGLTMSTTSCNLGTVDVPWLAPMLEDHPLIHMALYRLLNGRFEQVGVSWMKHGFFALSNSQCTPCQNPSGGQFLGVGCSDTYGTTNNEDRNYLGPRSEVDPYQGTWECTASHFAGGQNDCVRRHGGGGHGVVDHRLEVQDLDLNNTDATYYYEGYYVVRGEQLKENNWASRICTMSWNGSVWQFTTPGTNNPHVYGPALNRWGDQRTTVNVAVGDGEVLLAVATTDLGGGMYHYEYALLNKDSDREIRSFSLPVVGVPGITNLGFHDNDANSGNDWQVTLDGSTVSWATDTYAQNPNANSLVFGYQFNFRFDAAAPPAAVNAALGIFKPGTGSSVEAATTGPLNSVTGVPGSPTVAQARLLPARPNPFAGSVTIPLELQSTAAVRLDVYDAAGRLVRTLREGNLAVGSQDVVWDGKDSGSRQVRAGVYYARLSAGETVAVQPMVLVK